jgi:hypothetical protein
VAFPTPSYPVKVAAARASNAWIALIPMRVTAVAQPVKASAVASVVPQEAHVVAMSVVVREAPYVQKGHAHSRFLDRAGHRRNRR